MGDTGKKWKKYEKVIGKLGKIWKACGQDPVLRMRLSTKNSNAKPFGAKLCRICNAKTLTQMHLPILHPTERQFSSFSQTRFSDGNRSLDRAFLVKVTQLLLRRHEPIQVKSLSHPIGDSCVCESCVLENSNVPYIAVYHPSSFSEQLDLEHAAPFIIRARPLVYH